MNALLCPQVKAVPLQQVDVTDPAYAIHVPWLSLERLAVSIRNVGILNPLALEEKGDGMFRIVNGRRRYEAARRIGLDQVPALILAPADPARRFLAAVHEHAVSRDLHDLEKARILDRLVSTYKMATDRVIQEVLPLLQIRPNRLQLARCLRLNRLPESLQAAVCRHLDGELALRLQAWAPADQDFFLDLLQRYRPNRNRQRELFKLLDELRARHLQETGGSGRNRRRAVLPLLWQESGAAQLPPPPQGSSERALLQLLGCLRRLRFPQLSRHEQRLAELKARLRLPPEIQIQTPPFFEGHRLHFAFSARSPEELSRLADKLSSVSAQMELGEIFELF